MQKTTWKGNECVTLFQGEYHASRSGAVLSTLLGSCVAACLYDPVTGVIGMNHFLLANPRYARTLEYTETEAGRYGIHSMELLINKMLTSGARRVNLRAKAFGGAVLLQHPPASNPNFFCVGDVNVRFILAFLKNERIPLVTRDLGGRRGRVIYFSPMDYSVHVKRARNTAVVKRDQKYWVQSIRRQEAVGANVELW